MVRLYTEEVNALRARREEIASELDWSRARYSKEQQEKMLDERSALDKVLASYPEENDKYVPRV